MRLQIRNVDLIGGGRTVNFDPGLNIVTGPITTGKTTLLRFCRGLIGGGLESFAREAREHVTHIAGQIQIGSDHYSIVRPFVTTATARVDVAGGGTALRLPAMKPDATSELTFGRWLLNRLDLPRLEVPSAPTRAESEPTPVSINDYMLYCELPQDEIDNAVFGSNDPFKNIKRRYVFQILYGLYDVHTAELQERLRDVLAEARQLRAMTTSFERLVVGTRWQNRAELQAEYRRLQEETEQWETRARGQPDQLPAQARVAREFLTAIDTRLDALNQQVRQEETAIPQLGQLISQLITQSERLTRSIVADQMLVDFDFIICPRCGSNVLSRRSSGEECYLCLQDPHMQVSREDLIREQDRVQTQLDEARDLRKRHEEALSELRARSLLLTNERAERSHQLDILAAGFVSDRAEAIATVAARTAELRSSLQAVEDYRRLYARLDETAGRFNELERQRADLEAEIESGRQSGSDVNERIHAFESEFDRILERFHAPRFASPPTARIDRRTYLPVVDGRRFDELSSQGLTVLVNVAHALAHHLAAIQLGLNLPGLLLIDGLTSNVGHEGEDLERVRGVYTFLAELSREIGDKLQIIVADNDVPSTAEQFIKLRLTEEDRLIRW